MCPYLAVHTLSGAVTDGEILYMRAPLRGGVEEEPGPI